MSKKRQQKNKEKEKFKDEDPKGISGLLNLGNSCYLNSILQCLLHLPEFIIYMNSKKLSDDLEYNKSININLSKEEKEKQDLHYKLVKEFEILIKQIWKGYPLKDLLKVINSHEIKNLEGIEEKSNPYNDNDNNNIIINNNTKYYLEPREFKKILSEAFPQFDGYLQQDAHEVLTSILESFHLALNKSFNEGGLLITKSISDTNLILARKTLSFRADASHRAVNDSFIEDNFFGQLSSIFTCYKCHKKLNETYEPFSSLELTIPIEKNINLYILPLNPSKFEQGKLNININDNMSYEDIYNQINKTNGYNFDNYIIYWPNEIKKKKENKKTRSLRSNKNNNSNDSYNNNLFCTYENEDIIINENNIDKCQNFINFKTSELIMMENYDINFFIKNNLYETSYYEYILEIRLLKNYKNNINYNIQENIPRLFKVYLLENGDDHLIYNYIYKYLELFIEKEKTKKNIIKSQNNNDNRNIYTNKKLSISSSPKNNAKNKKKKESKKIIIQDINDFNIKSSCLTNNNISLEEEEEKTEINYEQKFILGVVCKNLSKENNNSNNIEVVCPLCNKKSKKIADGYCECFCINDFFDNELKIKNKELKKLFSTKLINFIENNTYSHNSLLSIIIHPYQNFSFINFNKFTMYTIRPNIPKTKKKVTCKHNLLDLFESFIAEEKIENTCICDNCGDINYTYQKKDIHKFPQILIIHIKRFKNEVEKNEERIEFPEEIDLSKYNNKGNLGLYSLNSAVFHQGTLISGHYTAVFKYMPNNKWLLCNDIKTKFLAGDKISGFNPVYNKDDVASIGDGYILFYRKMAE